MPRIPKTNINTPFLHIMIQGNNKNHIFNNKDDIKKYLKILKITKDEIDVIIIAYCIMGNHAHLLFYTDDINKIIKYMHKTNLLYAKYYNNKYDRVGYVFRDRYKVQPIMSEKHLITCIDYIHKNPVKARICDEASKYLYSSYNKNLFENNNDFESKIRKYIDSRKQVYKDTYTDFILLEDEENIETKEEIAKNLVRSYLNKKNIDLNELQHNKILLAKMAKWLKEKHNISYRISSKVLGVGREKLRKLINETDKKKGNQHE